ncbi:heme-binding protein [Roseibium denhamense]|nr:heme-binding protein [Roseibium denhamense]MTI04220.1 heme-binding protein [Roseibium denhamense]
MIRSLKSLKTMLFLTVLLLAGVVIATTAVFTRAAASLEQPSYQVVASEGAIEIRRYEPMAAVEVTVTGTRGAATRKAFRILFDYISGANEGSEKVSMTAPVRQETASQKISMTAPVTQSASADGSWQVAFYLPSKYTAKTAPRPVDDRIKRITVPGKEVAAITFSGRWTDSNFERHLSELQDYLARTGRTPSGPPVYAYFNDPFTLPPFRRNEVQVPLAR